MEDDLREGYTNLTFFGYILCAIPILLSIWIYFGSFGILDRSLKEIEEERNRGFSTESLIEYYDWYRMKLILFANIYITEDTKSGFDVKIISLQNC